MTEWYYSQDNRQQGPVTLDRLQALAAEGQLKPIDMVWNPSLPQWVRADTVAELRMGQNPIATSLPDEPAAPPAGPVVPAAVLPYEGPSMNAVAATDRALEMLRQTRPWVRFISILLFVVTVWMMGMSALIGIAGLSGPRSGMLLVAMPYVFISVGYFFAGLYLHRYATSINKLLMMRRPEDLEAALEAQKAFWRLVGILFAIMLVLTLGLVGLGGIIAALS